jgi:hypothetical protein
MHHSLTDSRKITLYNVIMCRWGAQFLNNYPEAVPVGNPAFILIETIRPPDPFEEDVSVLRVQAVFRDAHNIRHSDETEK